jgi:hypothetical protein
VVYNELSEEEWVEDIEGGSISMSDERCRGMDCAFGHITLSPFL